MARGWSGANIQVPNRGSDSTEALAIYRNENPELDPRAGTMLGNRARLIRETQPLKRINKNAINVGRFESCPVE